MRAIFINTKNREVKEIEFKGDFQDIQTLLEVDCFTCVQMDDEGNTLYVDDNGLFNEENDFFQVNTSDLRLSHPYPLSGNGLILGTDDEGESVGTEMEVPQVEFFTRGEIAVMAKMGAF
jgi:hypothetical protein